MRRGRSPVCQGTPGQVSHATLPGSPTRWVQLPAPGCLPALLRPGGGHDRVVAPEESEKTHGPGMQPGQQPGSRNQEACLCGPAVTQGIGQVLASLGLWTSVLRQTSRFFWGSVPGCCNRTCKGSRKTMPPRALATPCPAPLSYSGVLDGPWGIRGALLPLTGMVPATPNAHLPLENPTGARDSLRLHTAG